jgi:hypothetical protein
MLRGLDSHLRSFVYLVICQLESVNRHGLNVLLVRQQPCKIPDQHPFQCHTKRSKLIWKDAIAEVVGNARLACCQTILATMLICSFLQLSIYRNTDDSKWISHNVSIAVGLDI